MMKTVLKAVSALAVIGAAGLAHAEGDAAAGEKVFRKCQACHAADKEQNKVGPHLVGVVGRPIASVDGFKYSDAMKAFGEGKVWDEATLTTYLAKPRDVVKGTSMAFAGLRKDEEIADVIAYMKSAGGGS